MLNPRATMKKILPRSTVKRRHVAVLVDFSRSYGRRILQGVAKFLRAHHEWSVQSEEWRWTDVVPAWFQNWKGDGAIAWVETPELDAFVRRLKVPVVDVRGSAPGCRFPLVDTDNRAVASLVAEHFLERGYRNYAFCGFVGANYSDQRGHFFQERLQQAGLMCSVYQPSEISRNPQTIELEKRGLLFQEHLERWIHSLPKPVGIMACNDIRGQQIMNACHRLNLAVPEIVALVGVDNDEIFCELSNPPLSSVALDTLRIGYEAADLLERMMAGMKPPTDPLLVPPLEIVPRRSSDALSIDNPQFVAGARFLREHSFESVNIKDAAQIAGMSRRQFERLFLSYIGRSPKAEVLRLRLEYAKKLLADTNWTLSQIADKTGFKSAAYLHAVFSQKVKMTPGKFRQSAILA
jgi:LacI family transcriptional regulator